MKRISAKELHDLPTGVVVLQPMLGHMLFAFKLKSEAVVIDDGVGEYVFDFAHMQPSLGGEEEAASFAKVVTSTVIKADAVGLMASFIMLDEGDVQDYMNWFMLRTSHAPVGARKKALEGDAIHVDAWLEQTPMYLDEDEKILNYVHFMMNYFRYSATWQIAHREFMAPYKLFVTYEGTRYRVTGASRFGDIYLQPNFEKDHGYDKRVGLNFEKLTNWGKEP